MIVKILGYHKEGGIIGESRAGVGWSDGEVVHSSITFGFNSEGQAAKPIGAWRVPPPSTPPES